MKADPIAPAYGRLFKAAAVAQYLGIRERHARALIASGELVAVRNHNGRLIGVYERDCDAWLKDHRRAAAPAVPLASGDARIAHLLPEERHFS